MEETKGYNGNREVKDLEKFVKSTLGGKRKNKSRKKKKSRKIKQDVKTFKIHVTDFIVTDFNFLNIKGIVCSM